MPDGTTGGTGAIATVPLAVAVVLLLETCCASGLLSGRSEVLAAEYVFSAVVARLYPLARSEKIARAACDEMPDETAGGTEAVSIEPLAVAVVLLLETGCT
jgi:hypothetical protein